MTEPTHNTARLPYRRPELKVFGTVAAVTTALAKGGSIKDGGPNNIKS